jgi:hypothetical protein
MDNDGCHQASEPKQGAATRAEENEWDKLLRVRYSARPYLFIIYHVSILLGTSSWAGFHLNSN